MISGATGFVGRHLVLEFVGSQTPVIALYRCPNKKKSTLDFLIEKTANRSQVLEQIEWRYADLTDWASLEMAFEGVTQVLHCAASVTLYPGSEETLMNINVHGTKQMVELAQKNQVEWFGHMSSIAALGSAPEGKTIDENHLWNKAELHSDYAYTKHLAELEVWKAFEEGMRGCIFNPGVILGPGTGSSPLEQLVQLVQKKNCLVTAGSSGFVSIDSVVQATCKVYEKKIHRQRFILVSENWTYQNICAVIIKLRNPQTKLKFISRKQLKAMLVLERLLGLFGRPRKLSASLIQSLTSKATYSGNKILQEVADFAYDDLEKKLEKWLQE